MALHASALTLAAIMPVVMFMSAVAAGTVPTGCTVSGATLVSCDSVVVHSLDLSNLGLNAIAPGALHNIDVERLWLNDNDFTSLPDDLLATARVNHTIHVYKNQLSSIPAALLQHDGVRGIQELDAQQNSISTIEAGAFDNLPELRTLVLHRNQLTDAGVPVDVFQGAPNLRTVKLQYNRLTYVPLWFPAATELREVILASNDIRAIADAAFGSSTKLERVDLDYNANLKRLPAGFLPGQPTLSVEGCGFPKDCFRQNEVEAILGGSRVCVCDSTSDADGDGYQDCVDDCPANAAIVFGEDANADGLPDCDSRTLWMEFAYTNAVLVSIVCVAGALGALVLYSPLRRHKDTITNYALLVFHAAMIVLAVADPVLDIMSTVEFVRRGLFLYSAVSGGVLLGSGIALRRFVYTEASFHACANKYACAQNRCVREVWAAVIGILVVVTGVFTPALVLLQHKLVPHMMSMGLCPARKGGRCCRRRVRGDRRGGRGSSSVVAPAATTGAASHARGLPQVGGAVNNNADTDNSEHAPVPAGRVFQPLNEAAASVTISSSRLAPPAVTDAVGADERRVAVVASPRSPGESAPISEDVAATRVQQWWRRHRVRRQQAAARLQGGLAPAVDRAVKDRQWARVAPMLWHKDDKALQSMLVESVVEGLPQACIQTMAIAVSESQSANVVLLLSLTVTMVTIGMKARVLLFITASKVLYAGLALLCAADVFLYFLAVGAAWPIVQAAHGGVVPMLYWFADFPVMASTPWWVQGLYWQVTATAALLWVVPAWRCARAVARRCQARCSSVGHAAIVVVVILVFEAAMLASTTMFLPLYALVGVMCWSLLAVWLAAVLSAGSQSHTMLASLHGWLRSTRAAIAVGCVVVVRVALWGSVPVVLWHPGTTGWDGDAKTLPRIIALVGYWECLVLGLVLTGVGAATTLWVERDLRCQRKGGPGPDGDAPASRAAITVARAQGASGVGSAMLALDDLA